ncbi:MAG: hypothetical protein Q4Q10_07860, partial [Eubacteriales bacterium]|nr:hypothetical protein [Eubacteriales bacterium]
RTSLAVSALRIMRYCHKDSEPPCRGTALHPAGRFCVDLSDKSVKSYLVRGGILGYAGNRERDKNSKGAFCNEI